jgi:RNA-binding protein
MPSRPSLPGPEKARLRGLGQRLETSLKLGREGPSPAFFRELRRQLDSLELVKLRFNGVERDERALLCDRIAGECPCDFVGSVGHTALFYRPRGERPEPPGADQE